MTSDSTRNNGFGPARWASLVALSVIVFVLAGCGSSDDNPENQAAGDTSTMSSDDDASTNQGGMADGQQIRARIIGNTVAGTMSPDSTYTEYYAADGTIRGAGYTAKWSIDDDKMCFNYDDAPQADCYAVMIDGNAVAWHRNDETQGKGTIQKGNPNNF